MPGGFRIQQRVDLRENLANRLSPFRVVSRSIEKIDLLQGERALWPGRVRHTHLALGFAHVFKQAIELARVGFVQQPEKSLVIALLCWKQQLPLVDLIVEKRREGDRQAIEEAFVDQGFNRGRHLLERHYRISSAGFPAISPARTPSTDAAVAATSTWCSGRSVSPVSPLR